MKRLLFTGRGSSGSWQIRGVQLGAAVGGHVLRSAEVPPNQHYSISVWVKRFHPDLLRIREASDFFVWDLVDPWPQPGGKNEWDRKQALTWLKQQLEFIRPNLCIGATYQMASDIQHLGFEAIWIPHHTRPGGGINPLRDEITTVVYEGSPAQIGKWAEVAMRLCQKRGWRFVMNPPDFAVADIVLSLRESSGYAPRNWKSNVKHANAGGTGTPFISHPEKGVLEMAIPGIEKIITKEKELDLALEQLTPRAERVRVADWMLSLSKSYSLDQVAERYKNALQKLQ